MRLAQCIEDEIQSLHVVREAPFISNTKTTVQGILGVNANMVLAESKQQARKEKR